MFKIAKPHRISSNIVQQIREAVLSGELKPGDRLPSEKELAEMFSVSKSSLREAIRALDALGLVNVRQGVSGGTFIREVDRETAISSLFNYIYFQNPSIREFIQLRIMIEPQIAAIAAQKADAEDLDDLENNLRLMRGKLDSGTFSYELDRYFHQRIAEIAGNRLICFVLDSLKNAIANIELQLELDARFCMNVYRSHQRIVAALRLQDPTAAKVEMAQHIEAVEKELTGCCNADSPFKQ
jgi:GntR family transcriptional repressor for pyruvate dehydrogenase complex